MPVVPHRPQQAQHRQMVLDGHLRQSDEGSQALPPSPDGRGMSGTATLVSVNVGMPADVAWRGKTVHTGIFKDPVQGPVMVRRLNLDGDGQGDLNGHGGEQRAVMVYQTESYDFWQRHLGR